MGFTTAAYYESQSTATLGNFAALADQHLTVSGDDIYIPSYRYLAGAMALGATVRLARVTSPSLRAMIEYDLEPIEYGATPSARPAFHDRFEDPLPLDINEALNFQMGNQASEGDFGIIWLSAGPISEIRGRIYSVRTTSSTTLTGNAWTLCTLTFPSTLPARKYQIVGAKFHSSTCIAGRLVIPGHPWRPGAIGTNTVLEIGDGRFRYGKAGVWGEFDSRQPPQAEFLATGADTSEVVVLDLIPL